LCARMCGKENRQEEKTESVLIHGKAILHRMTAFLCTAVCSGVLCIALVQNVMAASVSNNAYSETVVDDSKGDVLTSDGHVVNTSEAEEQKTEEIQSNSVEGWPQGPAITAKSAILIDAYTGTILYSKNIHEKMYPASTTKLLTCLIAAENLNLSDTITFSESAIAAVPADGSNIGMSVGETITVEEALYGLMVGSANEVANALAEKVSGSIDAFVQKMNERAAELGCVESNFVNTNGLYDDNHYTSAYDLGRIALAFFDNEVCRQVGNCATYHFQATDTQPDDFTLTNKHELITGATAYTGIIGGKTGYTSQSHENLVTGCEQGDRRLVCVVMREDSPAQFEDTVTLFNYGYEEFTSASVEDTALPATDCASFLMEGMDLLGSDTPALTIASGGSVVMPDGTNVSDLTAVYGQDNTITYYYGGTEGVQVGTTVLVPASLSDDSEVSVAGEVSEKYATQGRRESVLQKFLSRYVMMGINDTIYINVSSFIVTIVIVSIIVSVFIRFSVSMKEARQRARQRRRRARRAHVQRNEYYENHRYDRGYDRTGEGYYDNRYSGDQYDDEY
jgi:serine-type D-Ala-D-Ala carboxypeptidase (penicillin-binding protein 5/6)